MRKNILALMLVAIVTVATSCGKSNGEYATQNAELLEYMLRFSNLTGIDIRDIKAEFGINDPKVYGLCYYNIVGSSEIKINAEAWSKLSDLGKEQIIFHELGHCAMDLDHDNTMVLDPYNTLVQGSIMNKFYFGSSATYKTYRIGYKEALRDRSLLSNFQHQ